MDLIAIRNAVCFIVAIGKSCLILTLTASSLQPKIHMYGCECTGLRWRLVFMTVVLQQTTVEGAQELPEQLNFIVKSL